MGLHNDWKTLKTKFGKLSKTLPSENFGGDLDAFEKAVVDFQKKCAEVDAMFDKLMAARKAANEKMGKYAGELAKDKTFYKVHGGEWIDFVSSLKKPMIVAGTAFDNTRKKCDADLRKAAGL